MGNFMKGPELNTTVQQKVSGVCQRIMEMGGDKVGFIILYGSAAKGKMSGMSDIDIAVFYKGNKGERFQFRMKILGRVSGIFDIQTFQDLPLYIQKDIMSTGDIIYYRDHAELFNINMKTIILCGGLGTRMKEETEFKPKPLVLIGGKPILWHIMKIYAHYGYTEFILALGYKAKYIKDYFLNQKAFTSDFTLNTI